MLLAVLLGVAGLSARLHAQAMWTIAAPITSQDMWGVCYGAGQFVAVGKGGTILTSPDGFVWTTRTSGTTRWLTAVAYGAQSGRFVAVGEEGAVLVSANAIDWTAVTTPTTQRLNAITYANGHFSAVGERHTRLFSETGDQWFFFSTGDSGATGWLRGLAHTSGGFFAVGQDGRVERWQFRNGGGALAPLDLGGTLEAVASGRGTVVAVGAGGTVWRGADARSSRPVRVVTGTITGLAAVVFANNLFLAAGDGGNAFVSDDGATWEGRLTSTTRSIRALAASDRAFVGVGLGGVLIRSEFAPRVPRIVTQPAALLEQAGSNAAFSVQAGGSEPLRYRWFKDGVLLAGATDSTLVLRAIGAGQAGNYSVEVANDFDAVRSAPAQLTVTAGPLPDGLVDAAFTPAPSATVRAIQPLADGRVAIGGDFGYQRTDGGTQQGIARLLADGQFDPTFDVGVGAIGGTVSALAVQADGKVLVGGAFTQIRGEARARLARLNANGSVDATFTPPDALGTPTQIAVLADGRILVADGGPLLRWLRTDGSVSQATTAIPSGFGVGNVNFSRFDVRAGGAVVAAGTASSVESYGRLVQFRFDGTLEWTENQPFAPPFPVAVRVLDSGDILVARQGAAGSRISTQGPTVLTRVSAQGVTGETLATMTQTGFGSGAAWLLSDGRAVLSSNVANANTSLSTGPVRNSLQRFTPDGTVDPTFLLGPGVDGNITAMTGTTDGSLYVGGSFTSIAGSSRTRLAKLKPSGSNPTVPRVFIAGPRTIEVRSGEALALSGQAVGTGPLTFRWQFQDEGGLSLNPFFSGSTTTTLTEVARDARWTGFYSLVVSGPAGTTVSEPVYVKVVPARAPVVARALEAQRINVGRDAVLGVQVEDFTGVTYQWYRDGVAIAGQTQGGLVLSQVGLSDRGVYAVEVRNSLGTVRVEARVDVVNAPVLVNVATRAPVATGDASLIAGFVVAGYPASGTKSVLARGVGPGLVPFGVTTAVADPRLTVFDGAGRQIAANDNWREQPGATPRASQIGFPLAENSKDAALDLQVTNGAYTAQVSGVGGATGVALAEIYEDTSSLRLGRIINLSTRAFVGTGEGISIPGFVLQGEGRMRVLVRGVGPTLANFGVNGALSNPTLTLVDRDGRTLAANDDWSAAANADEVAQAAVQSGAFALPPGSRDAALVIELPAGSYTARVTGVGGETGVGLVEVYEVP